MEFDIYQSVAVGVAALLAGGFLNRKIAFLNRMCIPSPVTGGLLVSLLTLAFHIILGIDVTFDSTVKDLCMLMFFTAVGFQSDFTMLRKGGKPLVVMVLLVLLLIVLQNIIGIGIAGAFGLNPLVGMASGSMPMCGGHGTAGGFSSLLEQMGLQEAASISMAAATFGLLAGSLLGGPVSDGLIRRNALKCTPISVSDENSLKPMAEVAKESLSEPSLKTGIKSSIASDTLAVFAIFISMGLGTIMNRALSALGISFPTYFGSLLVAALIRNFTELVPHCPQLPIKQITGVGSIALSLFLGIAMISLRLWELAALALPLAAILASQVLLMWAFSRFIAFPLFGGNYDAAVLVGGLCGFGLGATPNAMANMSAVSSKYGYSELPFIVVPLVGAIFVDIMNLTIITLFLNLLG